MTMQTQAKVISHLLCLVGAVSAVFTVSDPSDQINPSDWTADNALLADYTVAPVSPEPEYMRDRFRD